MTRAVTPQKITQLQVTVDQVVPTRGIAICLESSTLKPVDVSILPLRTRIPAAGEKWLIDKMFGVWTFAALLASPTLFPRVTTVAAVAPSAPQIGDRWVPTPAKVWDGTSWVDE